MAKAKLKLVPEAPRALQESADGPLDRLASAIEEVRAGARISPRTAKLFASGPAKMAQKLIEEAAEAGIEAVLGNRKALVNESVDLIYNLLALWSALDVPPGDICAEMDRRESLLGMAEILPKPIGADSQEI